jgi:hypothetical protein
MKCFLLTKLARSQNLMIQPDHFTNKAARNFYLGANTLPFNYGVNMQSQQNVCPYVMCWEVFINIHSTDHIMFRTYILAK